MSNVKFIRLATNHFPLSGTVNMSLLTWGFLDIFHDMFQVFHKFVYILSLIVHVLILIEDFECLIN